MAAALSGAPVYDLGDIPAARERRRALAEATRSRAVAAPGVLVEERTLPRPGGPAGGDDVVVRIHRPSGGAAGGRLLWVHGGGHVLGEAAQDDWLLADVVVRTGCTAVAVDWRRAPEHPFPAALDDCWAGLVWLAGQGGGPLVVAGASSGGGLAAGLVLLARDRAEVRVDAQLLVYPMLDDRHLTPSSRAVTDPRVWHRGLNERAWAAYLGGEPGGAGVSPYAAPSRAEDLAGLPPTWMATGELDAFVDEDVDYAARLLRSGVSTELHVYPGAVHGFDLLAPDAAVSRRFADDRAAAFERLLAV
ncbi:alpha/beta hydrolase [Nocardioides sp. CPCC 205120]|uniref:alpha/beta hydrolase n=1 Tax=Nocardioides sp. CPCC 205120 TaxID=3406462 RepID=UPI003B50D5C5